MAEHVDILLSEQEVDQSAKIMPAKRYIWYASLREAAFLCVNWQRELPYR